MRPLWGELRLKAFCVCNRQSQQQISRLHPQWMPESPAAIAKLVRQTAVHDKICNRHQLPVLSWETQSLVNQTQQLWGLQSQLQEALQVVTSLLTTKNMV